MAREAAGCPESIKGDQEDSGEIPSDRETVGTYVYVMGAEEGLRKIGITGSLAFRRSNIAALEKANIKVLFSVPLMSSDAKTVEKKAHIILARKRVRGEWFNVTTETAIRAVQRAIRETSCSVQDPSDLQFQDTTRKIIAFPVSMMREVDDFRFTERIPTESEAIRRLVQEALEARRKPKKR
jgi:hypothetical protein